MPWDAHIPRKTVGAAAFRRFALRGRTAISRCQVLRAKLSTAKKSFPKARSTIQRSNGHRPSISSPTTRARFGLSTSRFDARDREVAASWRNELDSVPFWKRWPRQTRGARRAWEVEARSILRSYEGLALIQTCGSTAHAARRLGPPFMTHAGKGLRQP